VWSTCPTMSDHAYPDALAPQYRLHWYVLERVLGQGGFGITYLARDTNLDQQVAIKEYLPLEVATRRSDTTVRPRTDDQTDRYRWGLDRFIREARTLARFDHPSIVRVHSVFEFNNTAYMVMRFEEGENFAALLERRRTLPEAELMRVLLPVLDGLELVHNAGFIHRDIKPDNIHIRADGSPVLLDFGSARAALGQARTVTILVAPGYAPFEQYYSSGEDQGPWTDLYGLAATCYRAIAGVAPLDAIARSKGVLGSAREMLVPAGAIGSGRYSARLLNAIDHALAFAEKERPQTIAEWRSELTREPAAPPPVAPAVAPASGGQAAVPTIRAAAPGRLAGTKGPLLGAIAGAIVAAVALGLWLRPGTDQQRLAELERRIEQQRQQEDEARKKADQERERLAKVEQQKELDRKREEEERERRKKEQDQKDVERKREEERQRLAKVTPRKDAERKPPAGAPPPVREQTAPPRETGPATLVQPAPAPAPAAQPVALAAPEPPRAEVATAPRKAPEQVVPKDDAEAFAFYRKLALQGDSDAQLRVGDMYASGRGVAQNNNSAYVWYGLAVRSGNSAAKVKQEQMAVKLQPAEVRQADRLIDRQARPARERSGG